MERELALEQLARDLESGGYRIVVFGNPAFGLNWSISWTMYRASVPRLWFEELDELTGTDPYTGYEDHHKNGKITYVRHYQVNDLLPDYQ